MIVRRLLTQELAEILIPHVADRASDGFVFISPGGKPGGGTTSTTAAAGRPSIRLGRMAWKSGRGSTTCATRSCRG
jgi:hypothetical protein